MPRTLRSPDRVARILFEIGVVKFEPTVLKSGAVSPIFINLRTTDNPKPGPLNQSAVDLIAELLLQKAMRARLTYKHIAGIPNTGTPLASAFARKLHFGYNPLITLGKSGSGETRSISGIESGSFKKGDTVLLIDDVVGTAASKFEAIGVLESVGLVIKDILVVVDRTEGGAEELHRKGYTTHALYNLRKLLQLYEDTRKITHEQHSEVLAYLATC